MPYSSVTGLVGTQQLAPFGLPDTVSRQTPGLVYNAVDSYWGGGEFLYVRATATIRMYATVTLLPVVASGAYRYDATEVANTANLGQTVGVAITPMTAGQFGWICIGGVVPVLSNATIASNNAIGIVAAGQLGANSAGKQILGARVTAPATTTVVKANSVARSASNLLQVTNSDGWFIGAYLSGTGIAASTIITDISPDGTQVTLSANTTAAVNGSVTATYNNATIFYNVAHINRPSAQGAIT